MGKKNKIKKNRDKHDGMIFNSSDLAMINEVDDLGDCSLIIEREMIDLGPSLGTSRPDPKWIFIDDHGHYHAFNIDKDDENPSELDLLPTLRSCSQVVGPDGEMDHWYECRICKTIIEPEFVPDYTPHANIIPGPLHWRAEIMATGPGALRLISLAHGNASFRMQTESLNLEQFGFGHLTTDVIENKGDFLVWRGRLIGSSPLGSRKIL